MIVLDSNVLLDVIVGDGEQAAWSRAMLARSAAEPLIINCVVRAETAGRFTSFEEQDGYLTRLGAMTMPIDAMAAYLAGLAHIRYRRNGGNRTAVLADFLIGGHASALGARLMTRDRARFAGYFPELTLITPEPQP